MNSPIETHDLTRRFGETVALAGISWTAPAGTATGLVGRNGSGKSTLLRIVTGLLLPDGGSCTTLGRPVAALGAHELSRLGYADQEAELLDWLTVDQHVRYMAAMQPRWDADLERRLREALELEPRKVVGELSKGMRQRLAVLLALAHRPELLLLDEPVSGVDPTMRQVVLDLCMERVIQDGATLVISSHVLHDVEKVVDRVLCLDAGRVTADASIDDLKEGYAEWIVTSPERELPAQFAEPFVLTRDGNGRYARLAVRAGNDELMAFRARHGVTVERRSLDLERIFPLISSADGAQKEPR
ncbi:MAG: ABC transporter ATP-binding protein [Planctomycetota bacterium]